MEIQWNDDLSTGVDKIDNQHKEIINRINTIINSSEKVISEEEIDKMVRFLGGYVIDHFGAEEEYMIKHKYPDYDAHKKLHMQFLKNFAIMKRLFEEENSTSLIILAIQNQAFDWLVKHILTEDKAMAEFLRRKI